MISRGVVLIASLLLSGCISQILSTEDWSKAWVGEPIERIERMHERDGESWYAVKKVSSNRTIYTSIQADYSSGKCYVDFTVNSYTGLIVDYYVYGDEGACE